MQVLCHIKLLKQKELITIENVSMLKVSSDSRGRKVGADDEPRAAKLMKPLSELNQESNLAL